MVEGLSLVTVIRAAVYLPKSKERVVYWYLIQGYLISFFFFKKIAKLRGSLHGERKILILGKS